MATEKTWNAIDVNRALSDGTTALGVSRSTLWYIKAFLAAQVGGATAGQWTVVGSSDSVTAGMDGVDRWGSTFDGTKIVRGSGAVAHSWIVLRSPSVTAGGISGVPFYFTIQFNAGADVSANFIFSKALPTGGSITARPTATDEWVHGGITLNDGTTAGPVRLNGWLATDGSIAIGAAKQASGQVSFGIIFHVLAGTYATDLYPVTSLAAYSTSGAFLANETWRGRTTDGASAIAAGVQHYPRSQSYDPRSQLTTATGDAPSGGKYLELLTLFYVGDIVQTGYRGRFADLVLAVPSGNAVQGWVDPIAGSPTSTILGNLWFPLAGTALVL